MGRSRDAWAVVERHGPLQLAIEKKMQSLLEFAERKASLIVASQQGASAAVTTYY